MIVLVSAVISVVMASDSTTEEILRVVFFAVFFLAGTYTVLHRKKFSVKSFSCLLFSYVALRYVYTLFVIIFAVNCERITVNFYE